MILICGIPSEEPVRLVIEAARRLRIEHSVLNQRYTDSDISLDTQGGRVAGKLRLGQIDHRLDDFSGIYARLMDWQDLPENMPRSRTSATADHARKASVFHATLCEWLEMADCLVMNRGSAMASNGSKPYQAQLISRVGFRTPATLITNDPDAVRAFVREVGPVVFKSISSIRSIVHRLRDVRFDDLEKIRNLPTQFQAFVVGVDVRVHVVGGRVLATEIMSDAEDYRYASQEGRKVEMHPIDLDAETAARCLDLSRTLDLPLCGIDLRRTPEGEYFCLEANPSPAYSYFQESTGQDIAGAIVEYLHAGH